jgi:hypothetical protein
MKVEQTSEGDLTQKSVANVVCKVKHANQRTGCDKDICPTGCLGRLWCDALSSSKMRFTHFEAFEEDVYTSENETKCGKAVNKQPIAGEYLMSQGTMHSFENDCEYCRDGVCQGNQSVPTATNCRNEDFLDR